MINAPVEEVIGKPSDRKIAFSLCSEPGRYLATSGPKIEVVDKRKNLRPDHGRRPRACVLMTGVIKPHDSETGELPAPDNAIGLVAALSMKLVLSVNWFTNNCGSEVSFICDLCDRVIIAAEKSLM